MMNIYFYLAVKDKECLCQKGVPLLFKGSFSPICCSHQDTNYPMYISKYGIETISERTRSVSGNQLNV
jgi:hypothetical protein